jgi:hypothetical protein
MDGVISVSVTGFMDFCNSPAHYKFNHIDKKIEVTRPMLFGRALHLACLEPEKFAADVYTELKALNGETVLVSMDDYRSFFNATGEKCPKTKAEAVTKFLELDPLDKVGFVSELELEKLYEKKTYLTEKEYSDCIQMRDSFFKHKFYDRYRTEGKREESLKCVIDGVEFRGRLDWSVFNPELGYYIVIDIKSCKSAQFHDFQREIWHRKYFIQAYLYSEMIKQKYMTDTLYAFGAIEKTGPFICEFYGADAGMIDAGEQLVKKKIKQFKKCFNDNVWPGYSDGLLNNISLPNYGFDEVARQIGDDND